MTQPVFPYDYVISGSVCYYISALIVKPGTVYNPDFDLINLSDSNATSIRSDFSVVEGSLSFAEFSGFSKLTYT